MLFFLIQLGSTYAGYQRFTVTAKNESEATQNSVSVVETPKEEEIQNLRPIGLEKPTVQDLKWFLYNTSITYGQDYHKMESVIQGESGFNWNAVGDDGKSIGIAQITKPTWTDFCTQFGIYENKNPYEQISCMGFMWSKGLKHRWTEYCKQYGKNDPKCSYVWG